MKNFSEKSKISVIVPVYRVEDYLKRCLDSIIHQSYKNLEIILVDDGSDDACPAICDEYARKDDRIIVIHKENGGLSSARNAGLNAATGDFIAFVDSDDYINKYMYEQMMTRLVENGADICMCDFEYVLEAGIATEAEKEPAAGSIEKFDGRKAQYLMCKDLVTRITYTVAWNKLYRKELFEGIRYPEGRIHEDEARTHELLYRGDVITYVRCPYYYYCKRDESIISSKASLNRYQLIDAYTDRLAFYRDKNESDLWQKEAVHAMRTCCRLQSELKQEGTSAIFSEQPQYVRLSSELRKNWKDESIPVALEIEIRFYTSFYKLYFKLFRFKRHMFGA